MPYHRFKIAQIVTSLSPDMQPDLFMIDRLLPLAGDEPQYRVTSTSDGHQRTLPESQITSHVGKNERTRAYRDGTANPTTPRSAAQMLTLAAEQGAEQ